MLVEHNHRLEDIGNYSLDKVVLLLHAVDRADARARISFVIDMSATVGALFGSAKELNEHIDALNDVVTGE